VALAGVAAAGSRSATGGLAVLPLQPVRRGRARLVPDEIKVWRLARCHDAMTVLTF
jgi:hypothetical protein